MTRNAMWPRRTIAGCLVLAISIFAGQAAQAEIVPVPLIENGMASLRVVHAVNPRLSKLSDHELAILLEEMTAIVKMHFGISLLLDKPKQKTVAELLAAIPKKALDIRGQEIYDFKTGTGNKKRLIDGYLKTLRSWKTPVAKLIDYASPYLVQPVSFRSLRGLAEALTQTHLARLEYWRTQPAADGKPMLDETLANEWIAWDLLGYNNMPFDVIVTNQPVISAEYDDGGLNSALRGGVSAGSTGYSKSGRYRTYSFISTFPFTEYKKLFKGSSDITSRDQAVRLAGKYMAHEIGHMLMLLAHPFANPACVMRPEPLFHFATWAKNLDAKKCQIGSSPAMTPGAAKIGFHPDW
ncbi:MAG: hypothetical protein HN725_19705 [Alphaproteobacteria bacterium]|jgi:hypothetical protein|nr:hypothetical protein [Alphaproteobacteria bacterium]MBT4546691.1 hypothetical protein [Alphaproteobacteria bacterium]MBT7747522.1 hypothetical protein [Alphaproteobacteria bacterium]